jgi:hypothetical protein
VAAEGGLEVLDHARDGLEGGGVVVTRSGDAAAALLDSAGTERDGLDLGAAEVDPDAQG